MRSPVEEQSFQEGRIDYQLRFVWLPIGFALGFGLILAAAFSMGSMEMRRRGIANVAVGLGDSRLVNIVIERLGDELKPTATGSETVPQVALMQPEETHEMTINRTGAG